MRFDRLLRLLPPDFELVLADVGSAGGLKGRWAPVRPAVSGLLFEPREGGTPRQEGRDRIFPIALGAEPGSARLNVTALPNMSSTLAPNATLLDTFQKKGPHVRIVDGLEMPVDTLDRVVVREGIRVDALKVDTQGSELTILEGARATLAQTVLLAEIEVSFFERYLGQAGFADVTAFMGELGFELIDLFRLKRYRKRNGAGVGNVKGLDRAGRLAYCDALFVLREDRLLERVAGGGEAVLLKAILGLLIYGKADMAARLLDLSGDCLDSLRAEKLRSCFRRMDGGFGGLLARFAKPNG